MKKCIRAVGKIAIRYEKSVEKCMAILSRAVKEAKDAVEHADHVVNELLIVLALLHRPCRISSENTLPNTTLMACS